MSFFTTRELVHEPRIYQADRSQGNAFALANWNEAQRESDYRPIDMHHTLSKGIDRPTTAIVANMLARNTASSFTAASL
jgi:hypothetical protein